MTGCGPGGPRLYKAGGTVTYNGKPVPQANVVFQHEDGSASSGTTDDAGKFSLTYQGNPKGAAAGKCSVAVNKVAGGSNVPLPIPAGVDTKDPKEMMKLMQKRAEEDKKKLDAGGLTPPKSELPAKYANFKTSGLSYEITSDEAKNNFAIELKD